MSSGRGSRLSLIDFLLRPAERRESDLSTIREFNFRRFDPGLAPGLELQWLGTAGFRIGFEGHAILIDPYFSRPSRAAVFSRRALQPIPDALALPRSPVDAVLVGHTHFDHVLDVPAIARRDGCRVYGSRSLAKLMALHRLSDRAVEVECNRVYPVGPFEITFVASCHSKLLLGLKVPADGELTCDSLDRLTGAAYRCGQVYGIHIRVAGTTFYHQGSANLIEEEIVHRGVDVFLCGISGRAFTRNYLPRVLARLQPRAIVPTHFDDFFAPLDQPIAFLPNVNLAKFAEEVRAVSGEFEIRSLEPMQTVGQTARLER